MILWHFAPSATEAQFKFVGSDPYIGLVLSPLDGRLHGDTEFSDPNAYIFRSQDRYPRPAQDFFWLFLDEAFLPDGRYLVYATSNAPSPVSTTYEVIIRAGARIDFIPPPGFTPPPFTVVTGAEVDPAGNGVSGVEVVMTLEAKKNNGAMASWGSVAGSSAVATDAAGTWAAPVAPSSRMIPPTAVYRLTRRHFSFGSKVNDDLFVPERVSISLQDLLAYSAIKAAQIVPAPDPEPLNVPDGYVVERGLVVDAIGRPMADVPVTVGMGLPQSPTSLIPNQVPQTETRRVFVPSDSIFTTSTPPSRLGTVSAFPGSPIGSAQLPPGSSIISILDGFGVSYGPPATTYDPVTGLLIFAVPFTGTVKYRTPSDGTFRVALPIGNSYWIQVGGSAVRATFKLYGGLSEFDIGKVTFQ